MSKNKPETTPETPPETPKQNSKQVIKKVQVELSYAGLQDGQVFYRGTKNGEKIATEDNPLIEIKSKKQTFTLEGEELKIDEQIKAYEDDDNISCKVI